MLGWTIRVQEWKKSDTYSGYNKDIMTLIKEEAMGR